MQLPGGGPEGREGLPPLLGFVGFGTDPEPLPNGPDEPPPPFPPPPGDEFDALPPGLPPPGLPDEARFPKSPTAFRELPPPPGLVVVTGEPAPGVRGDRPEPAPNGSSEGMSPFLLAPDGELDALPPGSPEARFPKPPIAFPELPLPPGLAVVTGGPAAGDRCIGPEEGLFNGPEEGSPLPAEAGGLFFSGLSGDLGFPASVKSGRFPPPLGREALTGGSLFAGSGEGFSGSLAIGLLGVSGEFKSSVGGGEGSTGVGGGVSVNGGSCLISGGGVVATGCSSGIGGGVVATGGSSGIGGGVVATGGSSGIGGGVAATGCSSGGVGSGGGSGFNVSGGGDTFSGIAGSGLVSST